MFSNPAGPQNADELLSFAPEPFRSMGKEKLLGIWAKATKESRNRIINMTNFIAALEKDDKETASKIVNKMDGVQLVQVAMILAKYDNSGFSESIKKAVNAKNN